MIETDLDLLMGKLISKGFEEVSLQLTETQMDQVRFSANTQDLYNTWDERNLFIFAARGKRTISTNLKDISRVNETVERLWNLAGQVPENKGFSSLNPEKKNCGKVPTFSPREYDLQDLAMGMTNSALAGGAERTAGLMYNRKSTVTVRTNYNECTFETGGLEVLIRSFKGEDTGQEARHFGLASSVNRNTIEQIGTDSTRWLLEGVPVHKLDPGRYSILMSPYVIGNLVSYSSSFLSYYSVESGLSCFPDEPGTRVSTGDFSLTDDPLDASGVGFRLCDDEGTPTGRTTLIENGILKNLMHSYSTARRAEARTTGHAGIISPRAWQLKVEPGEEESSRMLSELEEGLLINNCWYTRYQDYRNGIFSTVPRDGVFYVKNGEILGRVNGIRISDSIPNILNSVKGVSRDTRTVKWWEEIAASTMPSVLVGNVNISRAF